MVADYLTDEMRNSGIALIRRMDEAGMSPVAAFWFYDPEADTWKLVIAEPGVAEKGPKERYREIRELLQQFPEETTGLSLSDISLTTPESPLVALLRSFIRTGPGIGGIRFKNNVVQGVLVHDAYIYRLS